MQLSEQPPRIVATDLDGTLLRSDGSISPRTLSAIRQAEDAGATVIFVSGRPPRWLDILAGAVGSHGLAVCANGALVYDVAGRRIVEQYPLAADAAMEVAHALRAAVPGVTFAMERELVYGKEPAFRHRWVLPQGALECELEVLLAEPVAKLLARHDEMAPAEFIKLGTDVIGELATATYSDGQALLEISAPGISKASTLAALCAERGVGADEVVAFGDMPNDVLMLEWAGTSYAMANAHPDVVAAADARCASNDEDGVAEVLEKLFA
ncbi:Cof-type HAD-IIB family hydrolase [Phytoactinopolyspora halotolerans]|uniref:HAD family phosphatase n=1 Tax=Phytoactinopolyspora halotolerans TaxID=1981512 RepID=A0A6L9SC57_9ACTN|nr:Cof-type HAD-IIB family hydrolase [Phytoactinopolyspora halotolerans]NEE01600.1 HAD family phosphatase [Phytoactinopolyspora halotolerans]